MSVKAYPQKNVNDLWLLKDILFSVGGSIGNHLCIAQVGISHDVFLNMLMIEWALVMIR